MPDFGRIIIQPGAEPETERGQYIGLRDDNGNGGSSDGQDD